MSGVFRYANPPAVHWGAGCIAGLDAELAAAGARSVALVTTRSVAGDPELAGLVERACGGRPVLATVLIGQHAPIADIEAGAAAVERSGAEALVSLGGGSPIDAAKIISTRAEAALPHLAVPTTLSVAELAAGAGMTDARREKVGVRDPRGLPAAVFYDEALAVRTPIELWLTTGVRALDHAVEGFLAPGEHPFSDVMCLEAARRLTEALPDAKARPADPAARGRGQLAAWFSYTLPGPTAGGLGHVLGKQIGARHGIPHGVTSCLLLPHVLRYRAGRQPDRAAALGAALGGDAAGAIARLLDRLVVPRHLAAFGLGEPQLREAAAAVSAAFDGAYPAEELLEVYLAAL